MAKTCFLLNFMYCMASILCFFFISQKKRFVCKAKYEMFSLKKSTDRAYVRERTEIPRPNWNEEHARKVNL